jgi:hypothetical protein
LRVLLARRLDHLWPRRTHRRLHPHSALSRNSRARASVVAALDGDHLRRLFRGLKANGT